MLLSMAITWYGNQSTADSCNFGALAVIWPLLRRMQVASIINSHLPADPQAEYDHGSVLTLLMAARRSAATRTVIRRSPSNWH